MLKTRIPEWMIVLWQSSWSQSRQHQLLGHKLVMYAECSWINWVIPWNLVYSQTYILREQRVVMQSRNVNWDILDRLEHFPHLDHEDYHSSITSTRPFLFILQRCQLLLFLSLSWPWVRHRIFSCAAFWTRYPHSHQERVSNTRSYPSTTYAQYMYVCF